MKYYALSQDVEFPDGWMLGRIQDVDYKKVWSLTSGNVVDGLPSEFAVEVDFDGEETDYTVGHMNVPMVSEGFKSIVEAFGANVSFVPIKLTNRKRAPKLFVMVANESFDCVDEELSDFEKFEPGNDIRPDLAGHYQSIAKLVIDEDKVPGAHVFRIEKEGALLIVSEDLKMKIEGENLKGCFFRDGF